MNLQMNNEERNRLTLELGQEMELYPIAIEGKAAIRCLTGGKGYSAKEYQGYLMLLDSNSHTLYATRQDGNDLMIAVWWLPEPQQFLLMKAP